MYGRNKTMYGRNKAGKLVTLFKDYRFYMVGVQGTSEWYGFKERKQALSKFHELVNSNIE